MKEKMRFGILVPNGFRRDLPVDASPSDQYEIIRSVAKEAEALGYDSLWLYDHFVAFPKITPESCFESWITLASLAAETRSIRLGTLVSCVAYREPALLAKMASTLDGISGGRLELGLGAGWYESEFKMYGIPFERPSVRIGRLDEAAQVVKKLWTEEVASFQGRYYVLRDARCEPKPLQKPHPPLLIGGGGEKLTLRVVARHGDMCNFALWLNVAEISRKKRILEGYCREYGRDPGSLENTAHREVIISKDGKEALRRAEALKPRSQPLPDFLQPRLVGNPAECASQMKVFADAGITYFMFYVYDSTTLEPLRLLAKEALPLFKDSYS